jgi:hypothetical protein
VAAKKAIQEIEEKPPEFGSMSQLGALAEWLRSGLQSRLHRFDSGRRLDESPAKVGFSFSCRKTVPGRALLGIPKGSMSFPTSTTAWSARPTVATCSRTRLPTSRWPLSPRRQVPIWRASWPTWPRFAVAFTDPSIILAQEFGAELWTLDGPSGATRLELSKRKFTPGSTNARLYGFQSAGMWGRRIACAS